MKRIIIVACITLFSLLTFAAFPQYPNKYFKHIPSTGILKNLTDDQLLEVVQKQTFRYFWEYGHPVSGLSRERSNTVKGAYYWNYINEVDTIPNFSLNEYGGDACAIGGTGFGIMAMLVATERGWISRDAALERLHKMIEFLLQAKTFHGVFPHFMNGTTGDPVTFGRIDEGGDLVETSYLMMGLLCAREYFSQNTPFERYLRDMITYLWTTVNWSWYENEAHTKLFWHWAPNQGFDMNFPIGGWNECLITYIVAASSPTHPITREVYRNCWMGTEGYLDNHTYYGIKLPLGNWGPVSKGGPLFFEHYTFQGIDPNGLRDLYTDYSEQTRNHTLIQRAYCMANPHGYNGYGEDCWGLTAGDSNQGYLAHDPANDRGVIQPTAALSSMPYTPKESMKVLRHFYEDWGNKLWGEYGFVDGFNPTTWWTSKTWLAIDEGPIVNMIENHRTGMLWKIFMNIPEIQNGLKKLGFHSPYLRDSVK